MLEGEGHIGGEMPGGVVVYLGLGPVEEHGVVGPDGQPGTGFGTSGEGVEEVGLEQAAAVVAGFRPGIREKDENSSQTDMIGQGSEGFGGVSLQKGGFGQL